MARCDGDIKGRFSDGLASPVLLRTSAVRRDADAVCGGSGAWRQLRGIRSRGMAATIFRRRNAASRWTKPRQRHSHRQPPRQILSAGEVRFRGAERVSLRVCRRSRQAPIFGLGPAKVAVGGGPELASGRNQSNVARRRLDFTTERRVPGQQRLSGSGAPGTLATACDLLFAAPAGLDRRSDRPVVSAGWYIPQGHSSSSSQTESEADRAAHSCPSEWCSEWCRASGPPPTKPFVPIIQSTT